MRTVCRCGYRGGGVCLGGVCPHPPWIEWLTDRCKNITFPQLLLRTVTQKKPQLDLFDPVHWAFFYKKIGLLYHQRYILRLIYGQNVGSIELTKGRCVSYWIYVILTKYVFNQTDFIHTVNTVDVTSKHWCFRCVTFFYSVHSREKW